VDTVRLERRGEDASGWRVLAGPADEPMVLGFLEPIYSLATGRRSGGWRAINHHLITLPGGTGRSAMACSIPTRRSVPPPADQAHPRDTPDVTIARPTAASQDTGRLDPALFVV
jgi:hypothetical protein